MKRNILSSAYPRNLQFVFAFTGSLLSLSSLAHLNLVIIIDWSNWMFKAAKFRFVLPKIGPRLSGQNSLTCEKSETYHRMKNFK